MTDTATVDAELAAIRLPRRVRQVPVSYEQRGLWYIQQTSPDASAYHLVFSAEVVADATMAARCLDILRDLTHEHAALRVSFSATAGLEQWVWEDVAPAIDVVDASGLTDDALREAIRTDARRPFDLAEPPLWRVRLYHRGGQRWVVACVLHHIAIDFWSLGLLLRAFADRLNDRVATPAPDGSAFAEYAAAQQVTLARSDLTQRWLAQWRERLAGAPARLNLPLDRPRPPLATYAGRSLTFALPAATSARLREAARAAGVTPFMCVMAIYQVLLAKFSGETDIVVGTPTSGRLDRRWRQALGNFVNTVPVRGRIDPLQSFSELLAATRTAVVDALRLQECPFAWLVEALQPPRDPSCSPIYQVALAWDRLPLLEAFHAFFTDAPAAAGIELAGMELRPYAVPQQEGQLDLLLEMGGERDGGYCGTFKYNFDLFDAGSIAALAESFVALADRLVSDPGAAVGDVSAASPAQAASLLARGTGPTLALPDRGAFALIATQAAHHPHRVAVVDHAGQHSYAELLRMAAAISARLQRLAVTRHERVGVMLDRNAPMLAALLGVLAVGATYVPLDPALPPERLALLARDAGLCLVLSETALRPHWPSCLPVCCIDDAQKWPLVHALPEVDPASPAYILYTSGSTGQPKGVRVSHRSLVNLLLAMQRELPIGADDALLAVTTISFDIAALELFLPLTVGARVVVCDRATATDPRALARRIAASGATWMQATPSTWRMLVDSGWTGEPSLHALCGGEALPATLAEALLARTASLRNVYGPTETTIWSTCGVVRPGQAIDLGQPLANTQLYVLDERQNLAPPGAPGELYIGGAGVALGYEARPELTRERFPSGLPVARQARLYRTGDRVRWTADGRLEHRGRLDFQVKLRGHRIEPGEIETQLRRQPAIRDAVVVVRDDRLVAYLQMDRPEALDTAAVRAALQAELPPYMLPSAFVALAAFPQTPNNKVDRNALPPPGETVSARFEAPRDAVEIGLARIWGEILGLSRICIHDSFFDLGGHSLLAVQLVAAVKREWGHDMPVSDLLRHSTVAELAAHIRRGATGVGQSCLVPLRRAEEETEAKKAGATPLFLFHPIGGNVFCYLELVRQLAPGRSVFALQSPGLDQEGEAEVTVETIARRCLDEIRRVQPHGPYALGGWCFGGVVAFEAARQLRDAGEAIARLIAIDSRAPVPENVPDIADDATLLSWFARDLATPFGKTLRIAPEDLRARPAEAMFDHVLDAARDIGVMPADADRSGMQRYFEVYLANGIALQTYLPPPAPLDLVLLRARDEAADYGPTLGWRGLIAGALTIHDVPGDHNSAMYAPNATAVAQAMDRELSAALQSVQLEYGR